MKALFALIVMSAFIGLTPEISDADGRDRHDRYYGKDRDHYSYKADRGREHGRKHEIRHGKAWKKQHRPERYWKKHRKHRHVAYKPIRKKVIYNSFMSPVIYREPVVYYPSSHLTIGVPNMSFYVSW